MQPTDASNPWKELRNRAELRPAAVGKVLPASSADLLRMVQELQIHQVELEIQQEELLTAQAQAETISNQYADLYNTAPIGYCTLSLGGLLRRLNSATCQLLGEPTTRLLGRRLVVFVDSSSLKQLSELLAKLLAAPGRRHSGELLLRRPDGQRLHVLVEGVAVQENPEQQIEAGYNLVLLDITERHRATEALQLNEARFRATFEQSHDGMLLLENNHFADANNAALRLLGLDSRTQLLGRPLSDYWPELQPGNRSTLELIDRCQRWAELHGWCRLELLRHRQTGTPVWDELSFNPITLRGQLLLHVGWRDITARKHIEDQLHQSEARVRQALDATGTGVWSLDMATHSVHPDARAQEIFGVGPGLPFELLKATMHPDDVAEVTQALATADHTASAFDIEHRLLRPDGSVRYVAATGSFEHDPATGQSRFLRGLVRDVTDRRLAEVERDYKNRLLQNLMRNIPVILARIGPDGRFREYSGMPLRRLALADNELVGQVAAERFPNSACHYQRLLAGEPVSYTTILVHHDQRTHLQVFGFFDQEQQEGILFGTDITETEHLKEEATRLRLRQQQELHAVILTTQEEERRRIAESLHNGVGQLLYATRLHLDQLPPSEGLHTSKELLNEAIRATRTVSFELTPPVLNDFGLPTALRELARRIPAGSLAIELDFRGLEGTLPQPLQTTVYRTVQELLNNTIKHAQAQELFVSVVRENDQLFVSVEDDGRGFAPEQPATGIGLASIRSRVELLGGTFEVRTRLGRGSNFFMQLPVRG